MEEEKTKIDHKILIITCLDRYDQIQGVLTDGDVMSTIKNPCKCVNEVCMLNYFYVKIRSEKKIGSSVKHKELLEELCKKTDHSFKSFFNETKKDDTDISICFLHFFTGKHDHFKLTDIIYKFDEIIMKVRINDPIKWIIMTENHIIILTNSDKEGFISSENPEDKTFLLKPHFEESHDKIIFKLNEIDKRESTCGKEPCFFKGIIVPKYASYFIFDPLNIGTLFLF